MKSTFTLPGLLALICGAHLTLSCGPPPPPPTVDDLAPPAEAEGQLFAAYRVMREDNPGAGRAFHRQRLSITVSREFLGTVKLDIPGAAGAFPVITSAGTRGALCYASEIIETEGAMVLFVSCLKTSTTNSPGGPEPIDGRFTVAVFR